MSTNVASVPTKYNQDLIEEPDFDYLIRLRGSGPNDIDFVVRETADVRERFISYFQEIEERIGTLEEREGTLVEVIASQKELLEYSGYYNAYLLGQINEGEFQEISNNYLINVQPNRGDLQRKIETVLFVTSLSFSSQELADIFRCEEEEITSALENIH